MSSNPNFQNGLDADTGFNTPGVYFLNIIISIIRLTKDPSQAKVYF